jgi:hypothetical protein
MMGESEGARVQIFDMDGIFKRSFGEFGQGEGKLTKPMGVAIDTDGRIYVTDSYQNVVQVFDNNGIYLGTVFDLVNPMRTPLGIAAGDSRVFIANLIGRNVDVYGIDTYMQMEVDPVSLSFQGQQGGADPATQDIEILNNGNGTLNWTAGTETSWISPSAASGTADPSQPSLVSIGVLLDSLTEGSYSGTIEISSASGETEVVSVDLTVTPAPPELSVSPSSLAFTSEDGSVPVAQQISIENTGGGDLSWTAEADSAWILLNKESGNGDDTVTVSIDASSLQTGTHNGNITVTAQGAGGSPAIIPVSLDIVVSKGTINVITNLSEASFTINGPASYAGSGTTWTITEAPIGTYTIVFAQVQGYEEPSSQVRILTKDSSVMFNGLYTLTDQEDTQILNRHIIVGAGPRDINPAKVKILDAIGNATGVEFNANGYTYGATIASGDIDGDGAYEIITAPGPGIANPAEISIFNSSGSELSQLKTTAFGYTYGANVATGDFDGDGSYEVIAGTGAGPDTPAYVKVFVYDSSGQVLQDSGINLLAYNTKYGVKVSAGDIDCDGYDELITAPGPGETNTGDIKIWEIDTSGGTGQWSASLKSGFTAPFDYGFSVNLAAGDLNGDGYDEIIAGAGPHSKASDIIKVFDKDGQITLEFNTNITRLYGVNVATGDLDGDGLAEIIAGAGAGKINRAIVKVFDSSGIEQARFKAMNTRYGVQVGFGAGQ